jgi:hypothetical protein
VPRNSPGGGILGCGSTELCWDCHNARTRGEACIQPRRKRGSGDLKALGSFSRTWLDCREGVFVQGTASRHKVFQVCLAEASSIKALRRSWHESRFQVVLVRETTNALSMQYPIRGKLNGTLILTALCSLLSFFEVHAWFQTSSIVRLFNEASLLKHVLLVPSFAIRLS